MLFWRRAESLVGPHCGGNRFAFVQPTWLLLSLISSSTLAQLTVP
jgi:hypothetical protein